MKICFITKFPPLVGGVATEAYWTAYLLAASGVEVHVITNAHEANPEYGLSDFSEFPQIQNLNIHHINNDVDFSHIPHSSAFVTRLAGLASKIVVENKCDIIYGNYFEPYGIAAGLASTWTQVPYVIRHAGSDIGRLYEHPDLQISYTHLLKNASKFVASKNILHKLTISKDKYIEPYQIFPISTIYHPYGEKMDLDSRIKDVFEGSHSMLKSYELYRSLCNKTLDQNSPVIGMFGKGSVGKSHFELVNALGKLKMSGCKFNLVLLLQANEKYIRKIHRLIEENKIEDCTFLLPFIAPWKIPEFIRACDGICYLEHNFPIQCRQSILPYEVVSCGSHLILSEDIMSSHFGDSNKYRQYFTVVKPNIEESLVRNIEEFVNNYKQKRDLAFEFYNQYVESKQLSFDECKLGLEKYFQQLTSEVLCQL